MALPWFKVYRDLTTHPKTYKLEHILGDRAITYLIRLWTGAATHAPDGDLRGIDSATIERWCQWRGRPGRLWSALESTGWVTRDTLVGWIGCQGSMIREIQRQNAKRTPETPKKPRGNPEETPRLEERRGEESREEKKERSVLSTPSVSDPDPVPTERESFNDIKMKDLGTGPLAGLVGALVKRANQVQTPRSQTIVGLAEAEVRPKTPAEYIKSPAGRALVLALPALGTFEDVLLDALTANWASYERKAGNDGTQAADAALRLWLRRDEDRLERRARYSGDHITEAESPASRARKAKRIAEQNRVGPYDGVAPSIMSLVKANGTK